IAVSPPSSISLLSLPDALPICLCLPLQGLIDRLEVLVRVARSPEQAVELLLGRRVLLLGALVGHQAGGLGDPKEVPLPAPDSGRSEEHTSELQSLTHLLCRLLL